MKFWQKFFKPQLYQSNQQYKPQSQTFFSTLGFLATGLYYLNDHFSSMLRQLKIKEKRLPQQQIIFQQYDGDQAQVVKFSMEFEEIFEHFENSKIGILICYFVNDRDKTKAIAGRIIDKQDQYLINEFLSNNKNFKLVTLPEVKSVQVDIPLHTFLQAPSLIAEMATYKLLNYVMKKEKANFNEETGVTIISDGKRMIKYAIPFGKDAIKYSLFKLQE